MVSRVFAWRQSKSHSKVALTRHRWQMCSLLRHSLALFAAAELSPAYLELRIRYAHNLRGHVAAPPPAGALFCASTIFVSMYAINVRMELT
jgi:hypothetical protein